MTEHGYPSPVELTDGELRALAMSGPKLNDNRLPERFWTKARVVSETGCWAWTASLFRGGYGRFYFGGAVCRAHRVSYGQLIDDLPKHHWGDPELDHLCRRRACVNPSHLELVPRRVNLARASGAASGSIRSRLTTGRCVRGHVDWVPDSKSGLRCRTCTRLRARQNDAVRHAEIGAAHRALGITRAAYIALYGQGRPAARAILDGLPSELERVR